MNRSILENELKAVGVSVNGWMPVLQCDACKHRWEPFQLAVDSTTPTAKLDYWKCPNQCNAAAKVSRNIETTLPKYVAINEIPGMIFGDEDLAAFKRYVRSMDLTEVPNRRE
jgi:hypothetical protein